MLAVVWKGLSVDSVVVAAVMTVLRSEKKLERFGEEKWRDLAGVWRITCENLSHERKEII